MMFPREFARHTARVGQVHDESIRETRAIEHETREMAREPREMLQKTREIDCAEMETVNIKSSSRSATVALDSIRESQVASGESEVASAPVDALGARFSVLEQAQEEQPEIEIMV